MTEIIKILNTLNDVSSMQSSKQIAWSNRRNMKLNVKCKIGRFWDSRRCLKMDSRMAGG